MLEHSAYRLEESRASTGTFDFVEPGTGLVVAVASPAATEPAKARPSNAILGDLLRFRAVFLLYAAVSLPVFLLRTVLGRQPFPPRETRPRLVVRRAGDGDVIFSLRESSGFLYDSRRVYDGSDGLIAQFRSRSKTTVRGGFIIIDLRGMADDWSDIGARPWLGVVEPASDALRVRLVGNPDAGRIALHDPPRVGAEPKGPARASRGDCSIVASSGLHDDPTGKVLVLAAALTLAWRPPS